jgi:hypothetical protein
MYPRNVSLMPVPTKVAFIKYRHRRDAAVALHLTNAILVDKLIQVIPWREDEMPSEAIALQSLFPGSQVEQLLVQNLPSLKLFYAMQDFHHHQQFLLPSMQIYETKFNELFI